MKIWTDNKGGVHSSGSGSIEKQQTELIAIMAYIQQRVTVSETIVTLVEKEAVKSAKK